MDASNLIEPLLTTGELCCMGATTYEEFRNFFIVMTTNAGVEQLERGTIGFSDQDMEQESLSAIKHYFSHEFRNQLDAIIQFNYLDNVTILKILAWKRNNFWSSMIIIKKWVPARWPA